MALVSRNKKPNGRLLSNIRWINWVFLVAKYKALKSRYKNKKAYSIKARLEREFDPEYYLKENPDVAAEGIDPLGHYQKFGWIEKRAPNDWFDEQAFRDLNPGLVKDGQNPFVAYLKKFNKNPAELSQVALSVTNKYVLFRFCNDPAMLARVAAAIDLDPMVALPNTARMPSTVITAAKPLVKAVQSMRREIGAKRYRYIITIPHIRMSGAARVATLLIDALAQIRDPDEILVVTTDSSEDEYGFWLPKNIDRLDLSAFTLGLKSEQSIKCLIDLLRGTGCQTLININSKLAWDMLVERGLQISQEINVITYLFTWEETDAGKRIGYPIQWLRETADFHHLLLTDSRNLAADIETRLGFSKTHGTEVIPLNTPAPKRDDPDFSKPAFDHKMRPRFLWAGRFDRQKRVDLLVQIARANPQFDFDVYGKALLDKDGIEKFSPPDNIYLKGTYKDLSDVLKLPYAGFLYTAQWDGIPTILLDMGNAGLPLVAPNVGGISELIREDSGWLIEQFDDVDAYSQALTEIVADPKEAERRSMRLQTWIETHFNTEQYIAAISEAMQRHEL